MKHGWKFDLCRDKLPTCPDEKHGHVYNHHGVLVTVYPGLKTKTQALGILQEVADLMNIDLLKSHPIITDIQNDIARSDLPEGE